MKQSHEFWAPTDVDHGVRLDVAHVGALEAALQAAALGGADVVTVFCGDRGLPTVTTYLPGCRLDELPRRRASRGRCGDTQRAE